MYKIQVEPITTAFSKQVLFIKAQQNEVEALVMRLRRTSNFNFKEL